MHLHPFHEIDTSLCDYAADIRAATPSAAAELLAPDAQALRAQLQQAQRRLEQNWRRQQAVRSQRCDLASLRLKAANPQLRLERGRARLQALAQRQHYATLQSLQRRALHLRGLARALESVSPLATLGRGYSLLQTEAGVVVQSSEQVRIGDAVRARLARGCLKLRVENSDLDA